MSRMIFVNLPVTDVKRSTAFYEAIGATRNPQFSDDSTSCMIISDTIFVMVMTHEKFSSFSPKKISDASKTAQVLLCLSADSREAVDDMLNSAAKDGKIDPRAPQDYGFMYGRAFEDPDGHIWEVMWMDQAAMEAGEHQSVG
jgi:predicted lactoylglutathione lyase